MLAAKAWHALLRKYGAADFQRVLSGRGESISTVKILARLHKAI
jgi:hypothetical protein